MRNEWRNDSLAFCELIRWSVQPGTRTTVMHCEYYEHRRDEYIIEKCVKLDTVIPVSQDRHPCCCCPGLQLRKRWYVSSWMFKAIWNVAKIVFFAVQVMIVVHFIVHHSKSRAQVASASQPKATSVATEEAACVSKAPTGADDDAPRWTRRDSVNRTYTYTFNSPLVWIGGMPRSGTTLMRVILDAHGDIRCAPETRIIPRLLTMRGTWTDQVEAAKLREAGVHDLAIDRAMAHFVMEVLAQHGEPARILCNKDPYTLENATYLARLFPNSKFILMIRDGRAVVNSIMKQRMNINGCKARNYSSCLESWNRSLSTMVRECDALGPNCMRVYYELLVVNTQWWIAQIMRFLQLNFDSAMLHYYEQIGVTGGIPVSRLERSTDQVRKPIYRDALTDWIVDFPKDAFREAAQRAPLLTQLGYDVLNFPPDYTSMKNRLK